MKKFRKKKGVLSIKDFKRVKTLLGLGLKRTDVATVTGWGNSTVYSINKNDTFADYKEVNRIRFSQAKTSKQEPVESADSKSDTSIVDCLYNIVTELRGLRKAWETSPKRK